MDFVGLLGSVPPLLDACMRDKKASIRVLRLVNKEASRVALLALKSYTLTLEGLNGIMNVNGAILVKKAHLHKLTVNIRSDRFSAASWFKTFVHTVGSSWSMLTSLSLNLKDATDTSFATTPFLEEAMVTLVKACPALISFSFSGHLSATFLRSLGQQCPLITFLTVSHLSPEEKAFLDELLMLQPSLLPNITRLCLEYGYENDILSDMSNNHSILTLDLQDYKLEVEDDWLRLPPNLQHLKLSCVNTDADELDGSGPPSLHAGRFLLGSLLTLEVDELVPGVSLDVFAKLMQAAPAFQRLIPTPGPNELCFTIHCSATSATDTAYLDILRQRMDLYTVRHIQYSITCKRTRANNHDNSNGSTRPSIFLLPEMRGAAHCTFSVMLPGDLRQMIKAFPDVQTLGLQACVETTDAEIQELAVCSELTAMRLDGCPKLSPMGLYAICQRLPHLHRVVYTGCPLLEGASMEVCLKLLQQQGSLATFLHDDGCN